MELFLILSQENEKLPLAEVEAVLECENIEYDLFLEHPALLILKNLENSYKILVERLAYTHEIAELILKTDLNNLEEDISNTDWEKHIDYSFAVRVKNLSKNDSSFLESKIGALINSKHPNKFKVNLSNPNSFIRVVLTDDNVFIGLRRFQINKKHFHDNKPHKRPFFYPGSMSPKLARAMVNLSGVKKGSNLLDPFCGTGGILIEAAIVGSKVYGSDIDKKMVFGTRKNLMYLDLNNFQINCLNALNLKLDKKMDAVVTDPPYGISSSTGNGKSLKIFEDFLNSISKNLKKNGKLCMASPHYLDVEAIVSNTDLEILDKYSIRMHKSLTRIIYLMEKQ